MAENTLYYGDNLDVLRRYIKGETIDLIYLDPPFNSKRGYNIIFDEQNGTQAAAQIKAFEDTWYWDQSAALTFKEVVEQGGNVSQVMQSFRTFLGTSNALAYLTMMAPRLVELRRVLKPTGSIYLHCDPTMSHYLKILLDAVFGGKNFQNEIAICYTGPSGARKSYPKKHDILFFYTKGDEWVFNADDIRIPYKELHTDKGKKAKIWGTSGKLQDEEIRKEYEKRGKIPEDYWLDIPTGGHISPSERLGYDTQKALKLLLRIIEASSNPNDVVLDPFCGCGTAIIGAQQLNRSWIGIDITQAAIVTIKERLRNIFGEGAKYNIIGEPVSLPDAKALAEQNRYQFQWWALGLVGARPTEEEDKKKGKDKGVDGRLFFHDESEGIETKQIIFSVKSGHLKREYVSELPHIVERENANIGVLITLEEPTQAMHSEAAAAGFYTPWGFGDSYPKVQILTIAELLEGKQVKYPRYSKNITFKEAKKIKKGKKDSETLDFDKGEF
jgi:site-specific DNA-methyltransferase (adenine-specific)